MTVVAPPGPPPTDAGAPTLGTVFDSLPPIELLGIHTVFDGESVLDGLNLAIAPGRITVLAGPSGVGKTVAIKHMMGLLEPTAGTVLLGGRDAAGMTLAERQAFLSDVSLMQQGRSLFQCGLFGSLSVLENVAHPLRHRRRLDEDDILARSHEMLARVGMARYERLMPADLSGGMSRRVAAARALVSDSPVVVMDDVNSGVDGIRREHLTELIAERQSETRASFLVTTHDAAIARKLADVLAVMKDGRVESRGTPAEVLGPTGFAFAFFSRERTGRALGPDFNVRAAVIAAANGETTFESSRLTPVLHLMLAWLVMGLPPAMIVSLLAICAR